MPAHRLREFLVDRMLRGKSLQSTRSLQDALGAFLHNLSRARDGFAAFPLLASNVEYLEESCRCS